MDIYEQIEEIKNQKDFTNFIKLLKQNLDENNGDWENDNLANFLDGLEGYSLDKSFESVSWRTFAEILLAARVYE